jgi:hypothetical protein
MKRNLDHKGDDNLANKMQEPQQPHSADLASNVPSQPTPEEGDQYVYSRIHGYRIRITNEDTGDVYKKILSSLKPEDSLEQGVPNTSAGGGGASVSGSGNQPSKSGGAGGSSVELVLRDIQDGGEEAKLWADEGTVTSVSQ